MENIQEQMKEFWGGSCYAYCIAWLFDGARTLKDLTSTVLEGWYDGYIDNDGFVSHPIQYINETCHTVPGFRDVVKVSLNSLSDLPEGNWIVEWKNPNGGSHFTVENKNTILSDTALFDPSGTSISRRNKKAISYRKYIK